VVPLEKFLPMPMHTSRVTDCARYILPNNYEILLTHFQITNNMLELMSTKYCHNSATFFSLNDLLYQWTQYYLCYLNLRY